MCNEDYDRKKIEFKSKSKQKAQKSEKIEKLVFKENR